MDVIAQATTPAATMSTAASSFDKTQQTAGTGGKTTGKTDAKLLFTQVLGEQMIQEDSA